MAPRGARTTERGGGGNIFVFHREADLHVSRPLIERLTILRNGSPKAGRTCQTFEAWLRRDHWFRSMAK
jgi:hypothetical protein